VRMSVALGVLANVCIWLFLKAGQAIKSERIALVPAQQEWLPHPDQRQAAKRISDRRLENPRDSLDATWAGCTGIEKLWSAPVSRILCTPVARGVTAIHLGRGLPTRLGATYPPAQRNHLDAGLFGIAARRDCPFHPN